MYPQRKLLMREGYDIYYLSHVESGDKDYIEFWNRVQNQPKESVFSSLHDVFQRFPEKGKNMIKFHDHTVHRDLPSTYLLTRWTRGRRR